ncbi:MAG: DUF1573 domain-containing protein [Candidatus Zixiibacteriota bacterium]
MVYDSAHPDSLKPVTLSASSLEWLPTEMASEKKLIVKNTSTTPLKMKLVSQPYGFAVIELPDGEIKQGKTREIKVKVDKSFTGTEFKKSFTVELNDSAKTRFTVPVTIGELQAPVATKQFPAKKVPFVDTTGAGASIQTGGKK